MRFLLVDAISELEPGRRATGIKNVTMSEDFLADHFPHRPIMPGMLVIESLVQLADWVVRAGTDFASIGLAAGFDRVKFRRVVRPGDQLRLEVEALWAEEPNGSGPERRFRGRASCAGTLAVSADLTLTPRPLADYLDPAEARRLLGQLRVGQEVGT